MTDGRCAEKIQRTHTREPQLTMFSNFLALLIVSVVLVAICHGEDSLSSLVKEVRHQRLQHAAKNVGVAQGASVKHSNVNKCGINIEKYVFI